MKIEFMSGKKSYLIGVQSQPTQGFFISFLFCFCLTFASAENKSSSQPDQKTEGRNGQAEKEVETLTVKMIDSLNRADPSAVEELFDVEAFRMRTEKASWESAKIVLGDQPKDSEIPIDEIIQQIIEKVEGKFSGGTFFSSLFLSGRYSFCGVASHSGRTTSTIRRINGDVLGDEFNFLTFVWSESGEGALRIVDIIDLLHERDLSVIFSDNVTSVVQTLQSGEGTADAQLNLEAMNAYRSQNYEEFFELYLQCAAVGNPSRLLQNAFLTAVVNFGVENMPAEIAEAMTDEQLANAPKLLRFEFQRGAGKFDDSLSTIGELQEVTFFDPYVNFLKLGVLNSAGRYDEAILEIDVISEKMGSYYTNNLVLKFSEAFCGAGEYEKFIKVMGEYQEHGFPELFITTVMENDPQMLTNFRGFLKSKPGFLWMIDNGVDENRLLRTIALIPSEN